MRRIFKRVSLLWPYLTKRSDLAATLVFPRSGNDQNLLRVVFERGYRDVRRASASSLSRDLPSFREVARHFDIEAEGRTSAAEERLQHPLSWLALPADHPIFDDLPDQSPIGSALRWTATHDRVAGPAVASVRRAWTRYRAEQEWLRLSSLRDGDEREPVAERDAYFVYTAIMEAVATILDSRVRETPLLDLDLSTRDWKRIDRALSARGVDSRTVGDLPPTAAGFLGCRGLGRTTLRHLVPALVVHIRTWRRKTASCTGQERSNQDRVQLETAFGELSDLFTVFAAAPGA